MKTTPTNEPTGKSGTFTIGGNLPVHRLGFGTMRFTGKGIWGEPSDRRECIATLRRAVELGVPRPASCCPTRLACRAASTDVFLRYFAAIDVSAVLRALDARLTLLMPVNHEADV